MKLLYRYLEHFDTSVLDVSIRESERTTLWGCMNGGQVVILTFDKRRRMRT